MRWNVKAAIGAAGGIALVRIQLVEATFYIRQGALMLFGGFLTNIGAGCKFASGEPNCDPSSAENWFLTAGPGVDGWPLTESR